jgi:hypothetical protein
VRAAQRAWLAAPILVLAGSATAQQSPAGAPATPVAQANSICGGQATCYEASDFAATITDFRTSQQGYYKLIDVTIRFTNKTANQLILGYANGSGVATDDRGNRYIIGGNNAIRGIGYVNGGSFDPRFAINPGAFGDARFELFLQGNPQVLGFNFELDLTVNEINSYQGDQHTLGGEFPLQFKGLANGAAGSAPGAVTYTNAGSVAGGGSSLASAPCANSKVQNLANGANGAVGNVQSAVASIGSIFGKKAPAAVANASVPCTNTDQSGATAAPSATAATTATGAATTTPATRAGVQNAVTSGGRGAAPVAPAKGVAKPTIPPAATTARPTTPAGTTARPVTPAPTTVKPATPAPTNVKPATPAPTTAKPAAPAANTTKPTTPANPANPQQPAKP